ncbi:MAG: hypothetical protein ORN26_02750 [Candidatus Pacebacteria bacterium]|nr:hypothetical protein [Candidatus Paceibacterota bacterium]
MADNIYDVLGFHIQDIDGDGLPDTYENKISIDKNNPDTDKDGLFDAQEVFSGTNPLNIDTDNDYVIDGLDLYPLDGSHTANTDNDGDGVDNAIENYIGMNNNNIDTDSDGIADGYDIYPLNPTNMPRLKTYVQKIEQSVSDNTFLKIQNPILSSATDIVFVAIMLLIPLLFYLFYKFYNILNRELEHYYHTFHNAIGYKEMFGGHSIKRDDKAYDVEQIKITHMNSNKKEYSEDYIKNIHNSHNIHDEEIPFNLPGQEDYSINTNNNIVEENQNEIVLTQKDLELKTK